MDDRIAVYETFIRNMLNVFCERYDEVHKQDSKSEFDQGREEAYWEILDIIKTRKEMIFEILAEDE